jgi:hypothetical protein
MGLAHSVEEGAKPYIDGITSAHGDFPSESFLGYGSKARGGPLVDQVTMIQGVEQCRNTSKQDAAMYAALLEYAVLIQLYSDVMYASSKYEQITSESSVSLCM